MQELRRWHLILQLRFYLQGHKRQVHELLSLPWPVGTAIIHEQSHQAPFVHEMSQLHVC